MSKELLEQLAKEHSSPFYSEVLRNQYGFTLDQLEALCKSYQAAAPIDNVAEALKKALHHYQEGVSASACAARIDAMYQGQTMSEQDYRAYTAMQQSVLKHAQSIKALIPTQANRTEG
jgi:antirestriction protein